LSRISGCLSLDFASVPPSIAGSDLTSQVARGPFRAAAVPARAIDRPQAHDAASGVTLLFDGVLFNPADIARETGALATADDASLALAAYLKHGESFLSRLSGIFGLVLFDSGKAFALLATDHFGVKPMNYRIESGTLYFASKFTPLLQAGTRARVDRLALLEFTMHGDVMPPRTVFEQIHALPQGCCLRVTRGAAPELVTYYDAASDVSEAEHTRLRGSSVEQVLDELDALLIRSVGENLRGTGQCAVALSGGVDSTVLCALARRQASVQAVHVSVPQGKGYDERRTAERIAKLNGVPLSVVTMSGELYRNTLVQATAANEMPLWHLQNLGYYLASQRAAELGIDTLLCGDTTGAMLSPASQLPWTHLSPLLNMLRRLPPAIGAFTQKLGYAAAGLPLDSHGFASYLPMATQLTDGYMRHWREQWSERAYGFVRKWAHRRVHAGKLAELHGFYGRFNYRGDRLGGAHGVEYRSPFGDRNALRFAMNLPYEFLVREGTPKWAIKAVGCRYIPRDVAFQTKVAWDMPGDEYLGPMAKPAFFADGYCTELFGIGRQALEGAVAHWQANHHRLSRMIHLEIWGRLYARGESAQTLQDHVARFG
jgi:asparagine synthase (glutamine-hydrolysing)